MSRTNKLEGAQLKIVRTAKSKGGIMLINDIETFGSELKKQRKRLGYTQAYISEFTGFSVSFISDIENGKATAEIGKVLHYANMLGMDVKLEARGEQ